MAAPCVSADRYGAPQYNRDLLRWDARCFQEKEARINCYKMKLGGSTGMHDRAPILPDELLCQRCHNAVSIRSTTSGEKKCGDVLIELLRSTAWAQHPGIFKVIKFFL